MSSVFIGAIATVFCCFSTIAHAACERPLLPPEGAKTYWYCDNDSDTVVVFVHGFNSNNRTAWLQQSTNLSSYTYWPQLVLDDDALDVPERSGRKPSIFLAGYYTALDSSIFLLRDAGEELFRALLERRDGKAALERHDIIFVAHSAGGIVVRDMLVNHTADFAGKRLGILLVASPSKGSRYPAIVAPLQSLTKNDLLNELKVGSSYLTALDQKFREAIAPGSRLSELRGKEIYEHRILGSDPLPNASRLAQLRRALLEGLAATVLQERIVEPSSAAVYFSNPSLIPESSHSSIAHPKDVNHPSHHALREVYRQVLAARARPCDPPPHFKLVLDISSPRSLPIETAAIRRDDLSYELIQLDASGGSLRSARVQRDSLSGFQTVSIAEPPFACPGDKFWAKLARVAATSTKLSEEQPLTEACFRRSRINSQDPKAFLRCQEGQACTIDKQLPGLAEACMSEDAVKTDPVLSGGGTAAASFWTVPSLFTLEEQVDEVVRPAFTEFMIDSPPVADVTTANAISYAVKVNGIPVHMDGLSPHVDRIPFNGKGGVHLNFALENLGFTGANDGHERIELELRYYAGNTVLKTARLAREYVSYHHAEPVALTSSGDTYEWRGLFRPSRVEPGFELVLGAGPTNSIVEQRARLNAEGRNYGGLAMIGVVRPGRPENPSAKLTMGFLLPTGQVRSRFSRDEVSALCRWVAEDPSFSGPMKHASFVWEFPSRTYVEFSNRRGPIVGPCQDI